MLLGKRQRTPIMRRTRSVSGMTVNMQVSNVEESVPDVEAEDGIKDPHAVTMGPGGSVSQTIHYRSPSARISSTNQIQNHVHVIDTPQFLRSCGLCKGRLAPGRDIYMYRGDTAFCSLECREQQMKQDERKEKSKVVSKKEQHHSSPPTPTSKSKASSTKTQTIAAAST